MSQELVNFGNILKIEPSVTQYAQIGFCRIWTREACRLARVRFDLRQWEIIPLEVCNIGGVDHTFLGVRHQQQVHDYYLYDGTGVGKYDPYFGPEQSAPRHLKDSHLDPFHSFF